VPIFDSASLARLLENLPAVEQQQQPTPAADKSIGWAPYAALAGGEAADIGTTLMAQSRGGREANPLLGNFGPGAIALKAGMAIPMALWMRHLDKTGHDKLAKALGYGASGALGALAAHNSQVGR